jgi:hypothetical protein
VLADVPFQKRMILDGANTVYGHKSKAFGKGDDGQTNPEGILIKAGKYSWPFSFKVPKNIPPSASYRAERVSVLVCLHPFSDRSELSTLLKQLWKFLGEKQSKLTNNFDLVASTTTPF